MAHFAELDGNLVVNVIVINNAALDADNEEESGLDFLESIYGHRNFKQTSYNAKKRYNYAGIGFTYDSTADAFIAPQPFNSWTLDSNYQWQAPKPYPTDDKDYFWDEELGDWVATEVM